MTGECDDGWQAIEARLEAERRRVNEEISGYPQPIPACDAQFNHLLAERTRIAAELARMHAARRAGLAPEDFAHRSDLVAPDLSG